MMRWILLLAFLTAPHSARAFDQKFSPPLPEPKQGFIGRWMTSYEAARVASRREGLPLIVYFQTNWCAPCHRMNREVIFTSNMTQRLGKSFVGVTLDGDSAGWLVSAFRVEVYPSTIIIAPNGRILSMFSGLKSKREFLSQLLKVHSSFGPELKAARVVALREARLAREIERQDSHETSAPKETVCDVPDSQAFSDAAAEAEREFATPQDTWLKTVKAVRKRDWKTFSGCLSLEAHSELTFELLAILAVTDAVKRAAVDGELTENSHEPFEERLEANLVAMCSRWIPAARMEAGEPLGRRPEEHSLHDVDDLRIINRQRELFFRGLDPKRKMDERRKARRDFVRGFANRSQMVGTLAELISFSSPDHQFPIPVSAAVQNFEATDSQAEAQLPGKAGMVGGTVQFQRLDSGQWRISSLRLLDAGQLLAQIRQHLKSLQDKPTVSRTK